MLQTEHLNVFPLITQRTQEGRNNVNYNEKNPFCNCWTCSKKLLSVVDRVRNVSILEPVNHRPS